jgi:hypothetical protein
MYKSNIFFLGSTFVELVFYVQSQLSAGTKHPPRKSNPYYYCYYELISSLFYILLLATGSARTPIERQGAKNILTAGSDL